MPQSRPGAVTLAWRTALLPRDSDCSVRREANLSAFDGFVAKYMGDGVLVYFGYPQAHEDDVERAVRAGLKLVAAPGILSKIRPRNCPNQSYVRCITDSGPAPGVGG